MRFALLAASMMFASPAAAQWMYQAEESAFGDSGTQLAMTGDMVSIFGFRCDDDGLVALYVTPEDFTPAQAEGFALANTSLLVRVDSNPPIKLPAAVDSVNGKLRATADADVDLPTQIRDAKRRVAVALELAGDRYHEKNFNAVGSTNSMTKLLANCKAVAE